MRQHIYSILKHKRTQQAKSFAILLDPDKCDETLLKRIVSLTEQHAPDFFLVGGSLVVSDELDNLVAYLKRKTDIPVILFPGNNHHVTPKADALLLLSLISGRNADYLIGQHVIAAPSLKRSRLEIIPTGYMLVNCGNQTTVSYISNTTPIPYDKPDIAATTALAGELLGLQVIYMDGGSGAHKPISAKMVKAVRKAVALPIIIGGGIRTGDEAISLFEAGADLIVVGTAIEETPELLKDIVEATREANKQFIED